MQFVHKIKKNYVGNVKSKGTGDKIHSENIVRKEKRTIAFTLIIPQSILMYVQSSYDNSGNSKTSRWLYLPKSCHFELRITCTRIRVTGLQLLTQTTVTACFALR